MLHIILNAVLKEMAYKINMAHEIPAARNAEKEEK
jgi:hypothetical protein